LTPGAIQSPDDRVGVLVMVALHPRIVDAVRASVEPLIPEHRPMPHPLGCNRHRIADRVCFEGILRGLVIGC